MNSEPAIRVDGLTCYYGRLRAVNQLTLAVPRGCVFGFLGRNGSGKTTTLRALLGLLEPARGGAFILGHPSRSLPPQVRRRIGYLSEGHPVFGWMRVREAAAFQASFYAEWDSEVFDSVVRYFGIDPDSRARSLSRGQRAGLSLALMLAPKPELLVLDDPAMGLDPVARYALLEAMLHFTRAEERTVLFSSHLLSDVERVADRIAILVDGELKADCPLETFRERVRKIALYHEAPNLEIPAIPGLLSVARLPGQALLALANFEDEPQSLLEATGADRAEEVPLGLEEAFLDYLGQRGERSSLLGAAGGAS